MVRSLLDGADLSRLRGLTDAGAETSVAACLVDAGVLQFDPDDAFWADRDRLVACGADMIGALSRRLEEAGASPEAVVTPAALGGDALALAFGAAMASSLEGGAWRSWCVLDARACDDGRVWEVARAAAEAGAGVLGALVTGVDSAPLWRASGWAVHEAPADDPVWLLGALDQLLASSPAAVLVSEPAIAVVSDDA